MIILEHVWGGGNHQPATSQTSTLESYFVAIKLYLCPENFTLQFKWKLYPRHLLQAVSASHSKGQYRWMLNRGPLDIASLIRRRNLLSFTLKVT